MSTGVSRLLRLASDALAGPLPEALPTPADLPSTRLGRELAQFLSCRNGFYAFESALLVRPLSSSNLPLGVVQWNRENLWRHSFKIDFTGVIFFAEDLFGVQFCLNKETIDSFDPETGEFQTIESTFDGWANWIFDDYSARTGWPLAHEWQMRYGGLEPGQRLLPQKPFVLGGQFSTENLYKLNDVEGMLFRSNIAVQLRDCPDGSAVVLKPNQKIWKPRQS